MDIKQQTGKKPCISPYVATGQEHFKNDKSGDPINLPC